MGSPRLRSRPTGGGLLFLTGARSWRPATAAPPGGSGRSSGVTSSFRRLLSGGFGRPPGAGAAAATRSWLIRVMTILRLRAPGCLLGQRRGERRGVGYMFGSAAPPLRPPACLPAREAFLPSPLSRLKNRSRKAPWGFRAVAAGPSAPARGCRLPTSRPGRRLLSFWGGACHFICPRDGRRT